MSGLAFKCDKETLSRALSFADRISGKPGFAARIGPPRMRLVLEGDDLTIRTAGHDKSAEVRLTVEGGGDGEVIISSSLVASIVPKLDDGDVELVSSNGDVKVACGAAKFTLPNATEWGASWESPAGGDTATVEASALSDAINRVIRVTDKEGPVLKGVLVEEVDDHKIRLVATDTYRLAMRDVGAGEVGDLFGGDGEANSVLLPGDLLDDIMRAAKEASGADECEARLTVEGRKATFEVGGIKVTGPLLEGEFPNYRSVIPDSATSTVRVDRDALERVVQRVCLVADGEKRKVELAASDESVSIRASSPDFGEAEDKVGCAVVGDPPTVQVSSEYLLQGLASFDPGEIELSFKDDNPQSVIVIRHVEDADSQLYLVMPIVA